MKQSSLQQLTPQSQGGNKQQGGRNHCETRAWRCIGEQNTRPSPCQEGENKVGQTEGRESLEDACLPETTLSILRKWDSAELSETQHTRAHTQRRPRNQNNLCTGWGNGRITWVYFGERDALLLLLDDTV